MISTILNLDTQENQIYYDSGYSDTPSPSSSTSSRALGSPMSQGGDNSTFNMHSMLNLYTTDESLGKMDFQRQSMFFTPNIMQNEQPELVIIEQPVDKFRFRYKSEMHGTHGSLMGANNGKSRKTFPTVELRGYRGKAIIRCSLFQTDTLSPSPHSHKLVVRHGDVDVCDPHDVAVSPEEGFRASFQGMGIIHTAKKHIVEELFAKKVRERTSELGQKLTTLEESKIKIVAEQEAKNMNLNQVRLAFTAYAVNKNDMLTYLCGPIFSRPINNMKSALTGELKIARLSAAISNAAGGDDLIILVEKVGKKNIKVRFFEIDDDDEVIWEDWGIFSEADVHHQYAIALRTPPYKNKDIDRNIDVFIQLVRPSDEDKSEPVPFRYKPRDFVISRKRPRTCSSALSSSELPETIVKGIQDGFKSSPQTSGSIGSLNQSDIIKQFLNDEIPTNFEEQIQIDSDELRQLVDDSLFAEFNKLEADGAMSTTHLKRAINLTEKSLEQNKVDEKVSEKSYLDYFKKIVSVVRKYSQTNIQKAKSEIIDIFTNANFNDDDILHNAIRLSDINTMVKLLKLIDQLEIYDVLQYQNNRSETCLHIACIYDKPEYIRPLINLGANPNIQNRQGNTALHIAVEDNMLMCACKIIEKLNYTKKSCELQIDLANDDGLTPLHLAVKKGNLEMVRKLLECGHASTKICISKNGNNVLHLAVEQNDIKIVKYLLETANVNINELNTSGFTPLKLAYSMDKRGKGIAQILVEHGATIGPSIDQAEMDSQPSKSNTDDSSTDDEDEKALQIDEYRCNFEGTEKLNTKIFSNDICMKKLSNIFDKNSKWEELAKLLNIEKFSSLWMQANSPTIAMFSFINCSKKSNINVEKIINAMKALNCNEAVQYISEMTKKQQL